MRPLTILLLLSLGFQNVGGAPATARNPAAEIPAGSEYVVGISPFLDKSVKDVIYRGLVRLLVEDLPLNSKLRVYDAFELKSITELSVPNAEAFKSPKTRANQFAPAIRDVKLFLAEEHAKPTNSHSSFEGAIRLPQFLDFLSENLRKTGLSPAVLLIGSPLYQDPKEPGFSMVDGYFPSDGHLHASREQSVFGFGKDAGPALPLNVHWVYFGDPWVSDLHRERVTRFWSLYLERRAAQLATFTGDLPTAMQSFREGAKPSPRGWTAAMDSKIEMLRVSRNVEITDWLTRDDLPDGAPPAPAIRLGPMKIGIRWAPNIDLDLYATPAPGGDTLFFQHVRSPMGYYYKDHRSSPGKEYEFIVFEAPVDVRELEVFVNFYKGYCPGGPRGEVRIEFDGRIYSAPFSIPAERGNLGRSGAAAQEFWTRIPVQEVLKIAAAG